MLIMLIIMLYIFLITLLIYHMEAALQPFFLKNFTLINFMKWFTPCFFFDRLDDRPFTFFTGMQQNILVI